MGPDNDIIQLVTPPPTRGLVVPAIRISILRLVPSTPPPLHTPVIKYRIPIFLRITGSEPPWIAPLVRICIKWGTGRPKWPAYNHKNIETLVRYNWGLWDTGISLIIKKMIYLLFLISLVIVRLIKFANNLVFYRNYYINNNPLIRFNHLLSLHNSLVLKYF